MSAAATASRTDVSLILGNSVPLLVMLPRLWRAKSTRGKDAGSPNTGGIGATEDEASRRFAAAAGDRLHCLKGHYFSAAA
jgi:hypothetical protein